MSRHFPPVGRLAAVLAAALLAAGCSGFPDRGPVLEGRNVDSLGSGLQSFAAPPVTGASPAAIVDGFLRAGEDVHEDHKVAREFLASPETPWQPDATIVVLDKAPQVTLVRQRAAGGGVTSDVGSGPSPRPGDVATVRVTGQVVAHVDGHGLMTLPGAGSAGTQPASFDGAYHLAADEHGQWRIDRVPAGAGLVLTDEQFLSSFRPLPLYFADATGRWLVPDVRWFPYLDADPVPTAMLVVTALLRGPASWLGPSVTTGTVPRTQLTPVGGVRLDGDVVHVDLDATIRRASPEQRRLLHAQLSATLRDLLNASDVVLTAGQAALDVPPGDGPRLWSDASRLDTGQFGRGDEAGQSRQDQPDQQVQATATEQQPLCLGQRNRVGELDTSPAKAVCRERKDLGGLARDDLTLAVADASGHLVAGLVAGGTAVVAVPAFTSPPVAPRRVLTGPGLTAPSIDTHGWIWSTTSDDRVLAGRLGSRQRRIDAPWLQGATIRAVRISPEGARALLLITRGAVTQAVVTGVVRGKDGAPRAFSPVTPLRVLGDLTRAVDGAWSDARDVVVLGSRATDTHLFVIQAQVGGERGQTPISTQVPDDATGLAISSPVDVYVRTADGKSAASVLGTWKPLDVRGLTLPD